MFPRGARLRRLRAAALWGARRPIAAATPAGRYLLGRGCALPPAAGDVGWLPDLWHPLEGRPFPGIVALVTDALTGAPLTVHRTWLTPDGSGKAPVGKPRLLLKGHDKAGGVVRVHPDEEVTTGLLVAEGLETALSAALGFAPVWACLDAGNLAALPALPGVECLTILADHDRPNPRTGKRPGPEAAGECARRWLAAGAEVRVWRSPAEGEDFNDFVAAGAAA
jgi:putative DNA primase/helicase